MMYDGKQEGTTGARIGRHCLDICLKMGIRGERPRRARKERAMGGGARGS